MCSGPVQRAFFVSKADSGDKTRAHRVTTGSVPGTSEVDVTVTWPTAFTDTNYTVTASVVIDEGGEGLRLRRIRSVSTTNCVVNVVNNGITSRTGTVHAIAMAD